MKEFSLFWHLIRGKPLQSSAEVRADKISCWALCPRISIILGNFKKAAIKLPDSWQQNLPDATSTEIVSWTVYFWVTRSICTSSQDLEQWEALLIASWQVIANDDLHLNFLGWSWPRFDSRQTLLWRPQSERLCEISGHCLRCERRNRNVF